jgi:sugar/nucleoside kinase (ribokinase family)
MEKVFLKDLADIFSINENEAFWYASHLGGRPKRSRRTRSRELTMEYARILARRLPVRVDLHTSTFAGSFTDETEVVVPAFDVPVLRTTGAGDAWNAGNIFGDALALPDACRLTFANAVAAYYVSSPTGEHPTLSQLVDFCSKQRGD